MAKVLMVEDDLEITELLEEYLSRYDIELFSVSSPITGLQKVENERFDLILVDLGLPEMDGLELCRILKKEHPEIPVIVSTARSDVGDKVVAFDIGVDDYVAKPYEPRELVARIKATIKRNEYLSVVRDTSTPFTIDRLKMQISMNGEVLDLTAAEFEIFALLLERKAQVVSRDLIANSVESMRWDSGERSIDVIISRIRHKIGDNPRRPHYIASVRGVGYKYIGD